VITVDLWLLVFHHVDSPRKKARVTREGESTELGVGAVYSTPSSTLRFAADSSNQIPGAADAVV
jgi:hypothetical protein